MKNIASIPLLWLTQMRSAFCLLMLCFAAYSQAATYTLTSGSYPPCDTSWSVSGKTYTCINNGRVTLASGDILAANTTITISAANGFSLASNTIGSSSANINLVSSYGTVVSGGTNTIYGSIQSSSGAVTLVGTTVSGAVTTGSAINLTGGTFNGLVTSTSNTITTNNASLLAGAKAQSGMNITGGTLTGAFTMTANNTATFSNVIMTSGSISGASTVSITGSTLGSSSTSISVTSNSGAISLNSTTVYGNLTAPGYSTVNVASGSQVTGTCSPNSTPANACNSAPVCTTGLVGGLVGNYFNNMTLSGSPAGTRVDTSVNFDWGTGTTGVAGVGADNFSVRWTGSLRAPSTGSYQFQTQSDDGVRLWVNNVLVIDNWNDHSVTTNTSTSVNLVAGQSYPVKLEFYENGGYAVMKLNWSQPNDSSFTAIGTQSGVVPDTSASCAVPVPTCNNGFIGGANGKYYNNKTLTGSPAGTRLDNAIDFNWGAGAPGVTGVGADNFSIRWDGTLKVATTGSYQFETVSDDGVRLWVNNVLVVDNWGDHSATSNITTAITLNANTNYPVRVEYYENGGDAVIQLHWKKPGDSTYSTINSCPSSLAGYTVTSSGTGITCAGEPITFTAVDSLGAAMAPPSGTNVTVGTNPATGTWVGGNTYSFNGTATSFVKYLQQTTPATLTMSITDGANTATGSINFVNAALKFYSDATGSVASATMLNQVAGTATGAGNNTPVLKAIRTDITTGACVAQTTGTRLVNLGYICRNPATCVAGQTFTVNSTAIQANANTNLTSPGYLPVSLTFDNTGTASIPLNYSDVGQVRLSAQLKLSASGNDPEITLSGSSTDFVVKPHTLAVSLVQTLGGVNNPAGTTGAFVNSAFLPGGTAFKMNVEARNSAGQRTPNFGNESLYNGETNQNNITLTNLTLVYPTAAAGGFATALTGSPSFSPTTPAGTFTNLNVIWDQVGSFTVQPRLADNDYLGAGDITLTTSPTIGRFYPDHFTLKPGALVINSCSASPSLIYMGQPAANWTYTLEAQGVTGTVMKNYGIYGNPAAKPYGVAENNKDGSNMMSRLSSAKNAIDFGVWTAGIWAPTAPGATFDRAATPDGPFSSLQLGLGLKDTFDSRSLSGTDMNAITSGACNGTGCAVLGTPWDVRFGRLRLDDAFGPETFPLSVNFATEYWTGNHFSVNAIDSCTLVPRAAITYPDGSLAVDAHRTVTLTGGATQGNYAYSASNPSYIEFRAGSAGQTFSSPAGGKGKFVVKVDLTTLPWLRFDWNQDGNYSDVSLPDANFVFGSYRGNDRIIYWRERLQ